MDGDSLIDGDGYVFEGNGSCRDSRKYASDFDAEHNGCNGLFHSASIESQSWLTKGWFMGKGRISIETDTGDSNSMQPSTMKALYERDSPACLSDTNICCDSIHLVFHTSVNLAALSRSILSKPSHPVIVAQ